MPYTDYNPNLKQNNTTSHKNYGAFCCSNGQYNSLKIENHNSKRKQHIFLTWKLNVGSWNFVW